MLTWENICLTADQASYIYKKVEQGSIVNIETIKQDIEDDRLDKDNDQRRRKSILLYNILEVQI